MISKYYFSNLFKKKNNFSEAIPDENLNQKIEKLMKLINSKRAIIYEASAVEKHLDLQFSKELRMDIIKRTIF